MIDAEKWNNLPNYLKFLTIKDVALLLDALGLNANLFVIDKERSGQFKWTDVKQEMEDDTIFHVIKYEDGGIEAEELYEDQVNCINKIKEVRLPGTDDYRYVVDVIAKNEQEAIDKFLDVYDEYIKTHKEEE